MLLITLSSCFISPFSKKIIETRNTAFLTETAPLPNDPRFDEVLQFARGFLKSVQVSDEGLNKCTENSSEIVDTFNELVTLIKNLKLNLELSKNMVLITDALYKLTKSFSDKKDLCSAALNDLSKSIIDKIDREDPYWRENLTLRVSRRATYIINIIDVSVKRCKNKEFSMLGEFLGKHALKILQESEMIVVEDK